MHFMFKLLLLCLSRVAYTLLACNWNNCGCCYDNSCVYTWQKGYYCSKGCVYGYYGLQCRNLCKINCLSCDNFESCNACTNGFWGPTCQLQCWRGCNSCDKDTANCNFDCKDNYYGHNCPLCPENCETCTVENGCVCNKDCQNRCPLNCIHCDSYYSCTACDSGYYGLTCNVDCPRNCKDEICNKDTGTCLSCDIGFYGNHCTHPCPKRCTNNSCKSDGACFACEKGYFSQQCDRMCPINCKDGCDKVNGACRNCIDGFFGVYCSRNCPINCLSCSSENYCSSCITGYKGQSCRDKCSNCKEGTECNKWTGNCKECPTGLYNINCAYKCSHPCKSCTLYNGHECKECIDGTFGKSHLETYTSCSHRCSSNCLKKTCDTISGYCLGGCLNGYWGDVCDKRCSDNCKDQTCSRTDGHCTNGCEHGYTSLSCNCPINCDCSASGDCSRCRNDFYIVERNCTCRNDLCSNSACTSCIVPDFYPENSACCPCSKHCKNNSCESASKCSLGCKEGYRGEECLEQCKDVDVRCLECSVVYTRGTGKCLKCMLGYYIRNTSISCTSCSNGCLNEICHQINGKCISGCKEGKWGIMCDRPCSNDCQTCDQTNGTCLICKAGKYLSDCSESCSINCNASNGAIMCAIENGECPNGCNSHDKYGTRCEHVCSSNCIDNKCDRKTGECLSGCIFNHYGKQCQNVCNVGCRNANGTSPCNSSNGECLTGCYDGYFGSLCNQICSPNCANNTCRRNTGTCNFGCTIGYVGSDCVQKVFC